MTAVATLTPQVSVADELVLSIGPRGYGGAVPGGIESFVAANPDVEVEWLKISDVPSESRKLYVTAFTAKAPTPDVMTVDIIWPGEFAKRGWIAPLSEHFTADETQHFGRTSRGRCSPQSVRQRRGDAGKGERRRPSVSWDNNKGALPTRASTCL
ncbi:MAG: extracellular solute-binding protein [Hyphomicrobiales bacterium]|nr:extracellular solute-binding protein [Hyphomicrobiales bacterium]